MDVRDVKISFLLFQNFCKSFFFENQNFFAKKTQFFIIKDISICSIHKYIFAKLNITTNTILTRVLHKAQNIKICMLKLQLREYFFLFICISPAFFQYDFFFISKNKSFFSNIVFFMKKKKTEFRESLREDTFLCFMLHKL